MMVAGPAFAQKVYIDYDKDYKIPADKTFMWQGGPDTVEDKNPLMHSRIKSGIEHYLSNGGWHEVESDPSIYVTYRTATQENLSFTTTSMGYGYPGGWYGGYYGGFGMGTSSTTASTYYTGTLVVDAWDAKTEKLVWRGTATNITVTDNPDKMVKKIDSALSKMVKKWQSIKEKEQKEQAKQK
jgi:hypothetical protein